MYILFFKICRVVNSVEACDLGNRATLVQRLEEVVCTIFRQK